MRIVMILILAGLANLLYSQRENSGIGYASLSDLAAGDKNVAIGYYPVATLNTSLYHESSITVNDLIRYAKEYKLECYNDSTEQCGWVFIQTGNCGELVSGYDDYRCWYNHKEPTFSEFIDWLCNKLNIE